MTCAKENSINASKNEIFDSSVILVNSVAAIKQLGGKFSRMCNNCVWLTNYRPKWLWAAVIMYRTCYKSNYLVTMRR